MTTARLPLLWTAVLVFGVRACQDVERVVERAYDQHGLVPKVRRMAKAFVFEHGNEGQKDGLGLRL